MATEDDLRALFGATPAENGEVDVTRAITRARARRLPRRIAAGSLGGLALAGILVVGVQVTLPQQQSVSTLQNEAIAPEPAPGQGAAASDAVKRAPAEKIHLCGGPLADVAPSQSGLRLDVTFPATAPIADGLVQGTVRLVNSSAERITGSTLIDPTITVSQAGIVLWHGTGKAGSTARIIDLGPGESADYPASFVAVRCDVTDDLGTTFRSDLPPLAPGEYELSAALDFQSSVPPADGSVAGLDLITGAVSGILLQ